MGYKEKMRQRAKEKSKGNRFTLAEGMNVFRLMPRRDPKTKKLIKGGEDGPVMGVKMHSDVGPDKRFIRCGKSYEDSSGDCWLCDKQMPELIRKGRHKQVEKMQPQDHIVAMASLIENDKFQKPQVWMPREGGKKSMGVKLLRAIGHQTKTIEDPKNGYNLSCERTGQGMNTDYDNIDIDERPTPVPENILKLIKPLEELVRPYSEKDQKAAFFGKPLEGEDEDEPDEEDEETEESDEETDEESADEDEEHGEDEPEDEDVPDEEESDEEEEPDEEVDEEEESDEETDDEEGEGEEETDDEDEEDEPEPPKKSSKKAAPPPAKKAAPAPAKKAAPPPPAKKAVKSKK